jgi:hypothetical protein
MNRHMLISFCFGALLLAALATLCFQFAPDQADHREVVALNLSVFVLGWASGWVAGTLVAPYNENEATLFSQISKGIWVFVSGYLLAKIDPLFGSLRDSGFFPLSNLSIFRMLMYLSVTIVVMLIVFLARKYGTWHLPSANGTGLIVSQVEARTEDRGERRAASADETAAT